MQDESRVLGITDILSRGSQLAYAVPSKSQDRVNDYLDAEAAGEAQPVRPRLSSTVMLLRDRAHAGADGGLAVFMQQRASSMAFVPDAVVFPGGSFDVLDDTCDIPWEGPDARAWGERMGCDEDVARRAIVTAAREVFEETGVLLARRPDGREIPNPMESEELRQARVQLSEHKLAFGQMLTDSRLLLWSDMLCPCAHWVTPPSEPRRYSTYFFRARMPLGQHADGKTTEAVKTGWADPAWLLKQQREGRLLLMPPTISNLTDLARFHSVSSACVERETLHVLPRPSRGADGTLTFRSVVQ